LVGFGGIPCQEMENMLHFRDDLENHLSLRPLDRRCSA
jgi:hypothetical protein